MSKRKSKKDESTSEESGSDESSSGSYYSSSSSPPPKKSKKSKKSSKSSKSKRKSSKKDKKRSSSKSKGKKKEKKAKTKGKKRNRKPKDYPKGAKSAYIYYTNDMRPKVKEQHPGSTFGELSKILGAMWKETSPEEREKYVAQGKEDKSRFDKEVVEYKKTHPDKSNSSTSSSSSAKKKKPKKKRNVDPDAPKKPPNSYFLFSHEYRPKMKAELEAKGDKTSVNKALGQKWGAMSEEEKQPYIDKAKIAQAQHKIATEEYTKNKAGGGSTAVEKKT
jgi:hypothetical protein